MIDESFPQALAQLKEIVRVMQKCVDDSAAAFLTNKAQVTAALEELHKQNKAQRAVLDTIKAGDSVWGAIQVFVRSQPAWAVAMVLVIGIIAWRAPAVINAIYAAPTQTTTITAPSLHK